MNCIIFYSCSIGFKETWYFAESTTCHTSSCSYRYTKVESVYETSETLPALSNGGNTGVGLGTTSVADVLKYHFFEFTTNIHGMAQNLRTYQGVLGTFNMYK